ncbi:hypothetical protein H1C71_024305 [Ictidomys tridecemlineatus]|nr:hypothetical protein H1C71_024305 [Ictidomys tridecemlineatus]
MGTITKSWKQIPGSSFASYPHPIHLLARQVSLGAVCITFNIWAMLKLSGLNLLETINADKILKILGMHYKKLLFYVWCTILFYNGKDFVNPLDNMHERLGAHQHQNTIHF